MATVTNTTPSTPLAGGTKGDGGINGNADIKGGGTSTSGITPPVNIPSGFTQVSTLSNDVIQTTPTSKFVWLEKTDGIRTVLLIERGHVFDVTNLDNINVVKSDLKSPKCIARTILDTEAYEGKYIVFDAIQVDGANIASDHYIQRMTKMQTFLKDVKDELPILVSAEYFALQTWDTVVKYINNYKSPRTSRIIDGVICQRVDMPYFKRGSPTGPAPVYKLKVPSMNTVDFYIRWVQEESCYYVYLYTNDYQYRTLCRKLPKINRHMQEHTGNDPYRTLPEKAYVLFASPFYNNVGRFRPRLQWDSKGYFPHCIEHANTLMQDMVREPMKYDKSIVELSFATDGWVPFRVRTDKQHSNSYYVGFSNMAVLFDPINPNQEAYFASEGSLTTNEATINIYHDCSHIIRQYMFETLFAKYRSRILDDNQREYADRRARNMGYSDVDDSGDVDRGMFPDINVGDDMDVDMPHGRWSPTIHMNDRTRGISNDVSRGIDSIYEPSQFADYIYESNAESETLADFNIHDYDDVKHVGFAILEQNMSDSNRPRSSSPRIQYHKPAASISLLDIAGGRGSDFFTYNNLGVINLFATDADRSALVKYARKRVMGSKHIRWQPLLEVTKPTPHDDTYLNVLHGFLGEDNSTLTREITSRFEYPKSGFDIIVMNYAFHYICYSKKAVEELAKMVSGLLHKSHGVFVMTYVDGDKVLSMMNGNKASVPPFTIELVDRKSTADFSAGDEDMQLVKMPLPTIDASGYRIEPLVTRKYIDIMAKHLKIVEEYHQVEAAQTYINKIANHSTATNYLGLFKATIFESL